MRAFAKWIVILALVLAPCAAVLAATCTSNTGARNWNTAATWNCGHVPATGDAVIVPNASTVTLNVNTNALASLQVDVGGTITLTGTSGFDLYVGGNIVNNGTLNFTASTGTNTIYLAGNNVTSTFSGSGTWLLDNLDLNGNVFACTGTCKVELSGSPNLQFNSATLFSALSGTNTFNALGNSTATVTFSRAGAQTIATSFVTYPNLVLAGNNTKTLSSGTLTVLGDMTVSAGTTYAGNSNNPSVNLAGDFLNSGTFTSGSGVFTFNGSSLQSLTGAATFISMKINNAAGLTLASGDITVSALLTLTSGNIITNANTLITSANCATSVSRTSGFVVGNLRKTIPAGASTCTFEIGSGSNYTPAVTVFVAGTGTGNITASTTGTEHGSIASSGIDATQSVNRFWTLTNGGVTLPVAGFTATFNYINATPIDLDALATPANFIVERWNGTSWFPTTLNATCTATPGTNLCEQVNGLTATTFGDFAIGEPLTNFNSNPGAFNAFETSTPAGSVLGRLYTKLVGTAFTLSIVAVANNAVTTAPSTAALTVDVIDASPVGGTLTAASNCRTSWTTVIQTQTVPAAVAWASGRVNVIITAPARAVRNARIRVTQGANVGCSTDNFSIRPQTLTITSTNATQNNSSGGPTIKTGAGFNLTASSVVGYDGTPVIDNTKILGTPTAGTIGGSFSAAPAGTGVAAGASFFYNEVGNVGLQANAVFDSGFTSVDQTTDCTADFSNALVGGKYGCLLGSTAVAQTLGVSGFGRFIPDNFDVSLNVPALAPACGTFTYVGQPFTYATAPVITVRARTGTTNGLTNATTVNYAGAYVKLTNSSLTPSTQLLRYSRFDSLGGGTTPALSTANVPGDPGVGSDPAVGIFTGGVGALTFSSGTGLLFTRSTTTPNLPFNADIALSVNVIDGDGIFYAGNPAAFGAASSGNGIAFSPPTAKEMRFGRMRLNNAYGSALLDLPLPLSVESYVVGGAFATNSADNCTTLQGSDLRFSFVATTPNLTACETAISPATNIYFYNGKASSTPASLTPAKLVKPGSNNNGSVDVGVNLNGVVGTIGRCTAQGAAGPTATNANIPWLQGNWGTASYNADPVGRATFGLFKSADEFIYLRENF